MQDFVSRVSVSGNLEHHLLCCGMWDSHGMPCEVVADIAGNGCDDDSTMYTSISYALCELVTKLVTCRHSALPDFSLLFFVF